MGQARAPLPLLTGSLDLWGPASLWPFPQSYRSPLPPNPHLSPARLTCALSPHPCPPWVLEDPAPTPESVKSSPKPPEIVAFSMLLLCTFLFLCYNNYILL